MQLPSMTHNKTAARYPRRQRAFPRSKELGNDGEPHKPERADRSGATKLRRLSLTQPAGTGA